MADTTISSLTNGFWDSNEDRYYYADEMTLPYSSFIETDGIFSGSPFVPYGAGTSTSYLSDDWEVSFSGSSLLIKGGSAYISGKWINTEDITYSNAPSSGSYYVIIHFDSGVDSRSCSLILRDKDTQPSLTTDMAELSVALVDFSSKTVTDYRATSKCPLICGKFRKMSPSTIESCLNSSFDSNWTPAYEKEGDFEDSLSDIGSLLSDCEEAVELALSTPDLNGNTIVYKDENGNLVDNTPEAGGNFCDGQTLEPIDDSTIESIIV